jgi:hypothetical protein
MAQSKVYFAGHRAWAIEEQPADICTGAAPFNLHVDDVGHSPILGPNSGGKLTFLAAITTTERAA